MLFLVNADGSGGLKRLTRYADRGWSWSPNGRRIAYVGISAAGRKAMFIVNTMGSPQPRRIDVSIPSGGPTPSYFSPTWSPDGTRLAFECCANGYQPNGNWIYLVRPDGSGLTRAYEGDIRGWSPDGRLLLVSRGFNALWKLFLVRSDGTLVRRLPGCSSGCGYVAWLPDSKSIIYNEQRRVYVARIAGSMRRALFTSHWAFPQFSVSADGSTIAYAEGEPSRGHVWRLSIVKIDGSRRRVVVESSKIGFWNPAWRPHQS
jgi:dipeptidyl aminopeptidase/acylaminoacyl peptidase